MHCFLQGAPKIGKSTLLRSALLPYERFVCGIMVQRLLKKGRLCGYRACVVNGLLPTIERKYQEGLEGIFLYNKIPLPGILEKVINRAAPLCTKERFHYILLDEIGGVELLSNQFMELLWGILALGKPVFGVLKSKQNLVQTARQLNLPDNIFKQWDKLHRHITLNGKLLTVTRDNMVQTGNFIEAAINNCRKRSAASGKGR